MEMKYDYKAKKLKFKLTRIYLPRIDFQIHSLVPWEHSSGTLVKLISESIHNKKEIQLQIHLDRMEQLPDKAIMS
jgi:hypothetical protein